MRIENIQKSKLIRSMYKDNIVNYDIADTDILEDEEILKEAKKRYIFALNNLKQIQKNNNEGIPGYIIFQDIIYRVESVNKDVRKITGNEAKEIKRRINK
jgi:hypothetical protein